jgi:hypothetical protein
MLIINVCIPDPPPPQKKGGIRKTLTHLPVLLNIIESALLLSLPHWDGHHFLFFLFHFLFFLFRFLVVFLLFLFLVFLIVEGVTFVLTYFVRLYQVLVKNNQGFGYGFRLGFDWVRSSGSGPGKMTKIIKT